MAEPRPIRDFVKIATDYARDVKYGRVVAGRYVKLAAERFLKDLKRKDLELRPRKVQSICMFIEKLRHIKGKWAGKPIVLEPWQIFILCNVFGWYVKATGKRRFRDVYLEIARKNAKSTLTSGVSLYLLGLDGEGGAEVYSAATTRDQARIVFSDAKRMVDKNPEIGRFTGITTTAHAVVHEDSASVFRAVSADAGVLDGLNVHGAMIDELHAHKTRDVLEVMDTGTGARENPIIWTITTAGSDISSVCYERRGYGINILEGDVEDEGSDSTFVMIFTIDPKDDWKDERVWGKANPNLGISVNLDDLRRKCASAIRVPGKQAGFKTKHLDVWVNAANAWMSPDDWAACADKDFDVEEFTPDQCWIAMDLSSKLDITAVQKLFWRAPRWYTIGRYYVPEDRVEDEDNTMYKSWVEQGFLIATPGNVVDYDRIIEDIVEDCAKFDVQCVAYDPFQAIRVVQELNELSIDTIEVRQTPLMLNEPMKEVESLVKSLGIVHDGNPCMDWMMSNVIAVANAKGQIIPGKESMLKKIDGPAALITAMAKAMRDQNSGSVYDDRKSLFL